MNSKKRNQSWFFFYYSFHTKRSYNKECYILNTYVMFIKIITILSLWLVSWTSLIAEKSIPWEILYPIKININEPIQSALTIWSQNKTELQLSYISRRLHEKDKLESNWKLSVDLHSEIESQIWTHKENIEKEIKRMNNDEYTLNKD